MTPRSMGIALLGITVGCSSTRQVPSLSPAIARQIHEAHPGKDVRVIPTPRYLPEYDGLPLAWVRTTARDTEIQRPFPWIDSETKNQGIVAPEQLTLPNHAVAEFAVDDHFKGAWVGAKVGAAMAAAMMLSAAMTWKKDSNSDSPLKTESRSDEAKFVGVVFGVPTVLISTVVGAIAGWTTHYRFSPSLSVAP